MSVLNRPVTRAAYVVVLNKDDPSPLAPESDDEKEKKEAEKKEEKDKKYHRIERSYGNFLRSFTLPDAADGSKVTAEFKDGVIKVRLLKSEKAKPKVIEVKVG